MDIRLLDSSARSSRYRFLATGSLVVFMAITVMRVDAQQLVPFGDVPATENFSEAEIATRGRQPDRPLTYAPWRKVCFKATQEAGSKMVCRTTINGRWDTGQIALRVRSDRTRGRSCRSSTNFRTCRIIPAAWHQIDCRPGLARSNSLCDLPRQWLRRRKRGDCQLHS